VDHQSATLKRTGLVVPCKSKGTYPPDKMAVVLTPPSKSVCFPPAVRGRERERERARERERERERDRQRGVKRIFFVTNTNPYFISGG
jgi:hypothetical protein